MKNGIFQILANLYVPKFKMEYSKNFKKKDMAQGRVKLNQEFKADLLAGKQVKIMMVT